MNNSIGFIVIRLIPLMMLLWALADNPYGYYILLRWVVCAIFAYCAIRAYQMRSTAWILIFGVNAGIYNPIFPVHLGRSMWVFVNIISSLLIIVSFFTLKQNGKQRDVIHEC
ncbi:hypothetical protein KKC52_13465 [bacterium]|nr:hypothetical protein [bacterium]